MDQVSVERLGDAAVLLIDRPHAANAISLATMDALETALDTAARLQPRCVLIRGSGDRVFVSGGDVKELASLRTHQEAADMARRMRSLLDRVATLPVPTIAALNGHALGGGAEVAVACDFRLAADHITIGFNQSTLGIMPAWGGVERLVGLVGRNHALRLLLAGRRLGTSEALRIGLVDSLALQAEFDAHCRQFVEALTDAPHSVVTSIKQIVNATSPNYHADTREAAIDAFATLWTAEEHWDAVDAMKQRSTVRRSIG
jgi:enoyl-CoA hydratase/carnithine racemase